MDAKKAIRSRYLDIRRNLPAEEVASKSRLIAERLRALESFRRADTYLCYVSSKDNEVDTHDLIRSLLAEGRTVLVPIAERNGTLLWSRMLDLEEMSLSRFGILEPRPECRRPTRPPEDALVIVPGIAFTRDGYRIGYGGGYYDRFLATHPGTKIALAFEVQLAPSFERSPHDVPVDIVVTEQSAYQRTVV
jgi:5-formyltetrahydrofolate cyclo-ligase